MQRQTNDRLRTQRGPCGRGPELAARELDDSDPLDELRLRGLRDLVGDLTDEQLRLRFSDDLAAVGGWYEGLSAAGKQGFWSNCDVWKSYREAVGRIIILFCK